ncbi:hypothetical protein DIPPA_29485 [Diplonema papillatum]|nr:hypothetical protein DIPPA_29485 [Diplonema papillatum]
MTSLEASMSEGSLTDIISDLIDWLVAHPRAWKDNPYTAIGAWATEKEDGTVFDVPDDDTAPDEDVGSPGGNVQPEDENAEKECVVDLMAEVDFALAAALKAGQKELSTASSHVACKAASEIIANVDAMRMMLSFELDYVYPVCDARDTEVLTMEHGLQEEALACLKQVAEAKLCLLGVVSGEPVTPSFLNATAALSAAYFRHRRHSELCTTAALRKLPRHDQQFLLRSAFERERFSGHLVVRLVFSHAASSRPYRASYRYLSLLRSHAPAAARARCLMLIQADLKGTCYLPLLLAEGLFCCSLYKD